MEEKIIAHRKKAVIGILQDIIHNGDHGPYGVATLKDSSIKDKKNSVTFSLCKHVWEDDRLPNQTDFGCHLVLEDLTKKDVGWRANKARFYRLDDQEEKQ